MTYGARQGSQEGTKGHRQADDPGSCQPAEQLHQCYPTEGTDKPECRGNATDHRQPHQLLRPPNDETPVKDRVCEKPKNGMPSRGKPAPTVNPADWPVLGSNMSVMLAGPNDEVFVDCESTCEIAEVSSSEEVPTRVESDTTSYGGES